MRLHERGVGVGLEGGSMGNSWREGMEMYKERRVSGVGKSMREGANGDRVGRVARGGGD